MTTSMFHRIQNQGFRANGMSLARRVVMDHSLMATAEQYTSANNRPGRQALSRRNTPSPRPSPSKSAIPSP